MKIEKKRVVNSSKLSITAKRAATAALGITAVAGLSACEETLSANGSSQPPETTPTCGVEECGSELSSSSYTDISSSQEPISSSSLEALSSAAKKNSSSSEEEPIQLSGDIAPFEDSSSSSEVETPQSSSNPIKIDTITPDTVKQEPYTIHCEESDSTGYNLRLCKDQNGLTIFSMVTTFEQDDLQA